MLVSHETSETLAAPGPPPKLCIWCHHNERKKGQRVCGDCHAFYMRERRRGMFERLLTPAEWALIQANRAEAAAAAAASSGASEGRPRGKHARIAELVEALG